MLFAERSIFYRIFKLCIHLPMSGKWLQLRRKGGERKRVVYSYMCYIWFWTRDSLDAEMSASVYSWQRTSCVILFLFDETTVRVGKFTDTPLNKNKNHGLSGNEIEQKGQMSQRWRGQWLGAVLWDQIQKDPDATIY